jgi:hypothetical protein
LSTNLEATNQNCLPAGIWKNKNLRPVFEFALVAFQKSRILQQSNNAIIQ